MHDPRLVHSTLHLPTLVPLLGAQSVIASGSVGPIWVLLSGRGFRKGCAILEPGHRHFLRVETLHVTVKSQRNVLGVGWQDGKLNRRAICGERVNNPLALPYGLLRSTQVFDWQKWQIQFYMKEKYDESLLPLIVKCLCATHRWY